MKPAASLALALLLLGLSTPSGGAPLSSRRSDIVEVVERVSPAVVNISAEQTVTRRGGSLLDDFFFGIEPRRRSSKSLGSGVIIDAKGIILTNDHVISGASKIVATTKGGRELECDVIGSDADNDLAVLRARDPGPSLPTIRMGTSSDLLIGETVVAIGNPFGLSNTVTAGVLSALGRSVPGENQRVLQRLPPDRRPDQPGKLGRPRRQHPGGPDRRRDGDHRRRSGHRLRDPRGPREADRGRPGQVRKVQPVWIGLHGRTITARGERDGSPRGFRVRRIEADSPAQRAGHPDG